MRKVLWITDRAGISGKLYGVWSQQVLTCGMAMAKIRITSLHANMKGTLLAPFRNRKAPTWRQDREADIKQAIHRLTKRGEYKIVVLTSPESLAVIGLSQEIATLDKLRGSVYHDEERGLTYLVTLPIASWYFKQSEKAIQSANYGLESEDAMNRAYEDADSDEVDTFYYEPMMIPTGKFFIMADMRKLSRLALDKAGKPFRAYDFQPKVRV